MGTDREVLLSRGMVNRANVNCGDGNGVVMGRWCFQGQWLVGVR